MVLIFVHLFVTHFRLLVQIYYFTTKTALDFPVIFDAQFSSCFHNISAQMLVIR
jgi:hypothetical protein